MSDIHVHYEAILARLGECGLNVEQECRGHLSFSPGFFLLFGVVIERPGQPPNQQTQTTTQHNNTTNNNNKQQTTTTTSKPQLPDPLYACIASSLQSL